jgi:hypothetical protein
VLILLRRFNLTLFYLGRRASGESLASKARFCDASL